MKSNPNKIICNKSLNRSMSRTYKILLVNILSTFLLLMPLLTFSQKHHKKAEEDNDVATNKSWSFSINTGAAFANKYQANFYNGDTTKNQNSINFILGNPYIVSTIRSAINDTFSLYGMPTAMKYDPAFCVGFSIKKKFNDHIGAFAQFNFSRFKATDVFTLKIGNTPVGTTTNVRLVNCPIWGKEDRINIDLGVSGEIFLANKIYGFLEAGLNINNTRVKENMISIDPIGEFSIINIYGNQQYIPNTQLQEYAIKEGGLGIGAFLSPGIEFRFNENVAVDVLGSVYYSKINLMHYDTFGLNYNAMIRFVFSTNVTVEN
jgi:hypothetical protein